MFTQDENEESSADGGRDEIRHTTCVQSTRSEELSRNVNQFPHVLTCARFAIRFLIYDWPRAFTEDLWVENNP